MTKSTSFNIQDIYTIAGPEIAKIYEENFMSVHFQGMSKCLQFPHTVALQGAPTCSIGISPYGLYNRLNDAGRLIMLNQKAVEFASAPFIRIGDKCTMLTQKQMPLGVEEFEVENTANAAQEITLVVPKPSLVNLQEKELKPTDQDSVY